MASILLESLTENIGWPPEVIASTGIAQDGRLGRLAIAGEGVMLLQFRAEDATDYWELGQESKEHLQRYGQGHVPQQSIGAVIRTFVEPLDALTLQFGIWCERDLVGAIMLRPSLEDNTAEIGYWIGSRFVRRGFASSSVRALAGFAFETLSHDELVAYVGLENQASCRTLERADFRLKNADAEEGPPTHYTFSRHRNDSAT